MALLPARAPRHCDYCGDAIRGRADKRFCNSECRNGYHNHHASIDDAFLREVNKVLRRNRRILARLSPDGKNYATRTRLEDLGFSFKYFTHVSPSREGQQYHWVYECGYLEIRHNYFMLVRRDGQRRDAPSPSATAERPPGAAQGA